MSSGGVPVVLGGVPISIPHSCSGEQLQRLFAPRVTGKGIIIPNLMSDNKGLSTVIAVNDGKIVAVGYFIGASFVSPTPFTGAKLLIVGISTKINGQ